ncbi:unnamed protein product [Trypanosoma congolense IL3000]|uniref:WGS project CAEQ00000000 data, annotated contig 1133 n=1 Tax=Trypanosoma congolense (strain IL3000) TaxID=1068625 RepID=F9W405_TRYCI|nr:unnamed protein product [Trypanosoma congolense IL3000]
MSHRRHCYPFRGVIYLAFRSFPRVLHRSKQRTRARSLLSKAKRLLSRRLRADKLCPHRYSPRPFAFSPHRDFGKPPKYVTLACGTFLRELLTCNAGPTACQSNVSPLLSPTPNTAVVSGEVELLQLLVSCTHSALQHATVQNYQGGHSSH